MGTSLDGISLKEQRKNFEELLNKFRIDVADVFILEGMNKPPKADKVSKFKKSFDILLANFDQRDDQDEEADVFSRYSQVTSAVLRRNELMQEHSGNSDLVVSTLPVVRTDTPAPLFLSWMEALTTGLGQVVLVRGNQESVLTF